MAMTKRDSNSVIFFWLFIIYEDMIKARFTQRTTCQFQIVPIIEPTRCFAGRLALLLGFSRLATRSFFLTAFCSLKGRWKAETFPSSHEIETKARRK